MPSLGQIPKKSSLGADTSEGEGKGSGCDKGSGSICDTWFFAGDPSAAEAPSSLRKKRFARFLRDDSSLRGRCELQ